MGESRYQALRRLQQRTGYVLGLGSDKKWHLFDLSDEGHVKGGDGMSTNEAVEYLIGADPAERLTPEEARNLLNQEIAEPTGALFPFAYPSPAEEDDLG